jgi:hypothetical protein
MSRNRALWRVSAAFITIGLLQGCDNESNRAPREATKSELMSPVLMKLQGSPKKQGPRAPKPVNGR